MLFDLINLFGLAIILIMMIPNIIYGKKHPEDFVNYWHNKSVEILEQIGRFGSFGFMVIFIPGTWFGFPNKICFLIYVIADLVLLLAYCLVWIFWFNKQCLLRTLCLTIFPSLIFILSGIFSRSVLLMISGVIFAPCHILISVMNLKLSKRG